MSRAWWILAAAALVSSELAAQGDLVQLSPRNKLVSVETWRKACGLRTLEQTVERAKNDLSKAKKITDSQKREEVSKRATKDLKEAQDNLEEVVSTDRLRTGQPGLSWLCGVQDVRTPAPNGVRLPTREEVIDAAEAIKKLEATNILTMGEGRGLLSFFGISEAKVISGLTTLLLDRAAAEIRIAFVDKITVQICAPASIKPLFTTTCTVLGEEHLKLRKSLLRELHSAIRNDLRALPHTGPLAAANRDDFRNNTLATDQQDAILIAYVLGTLTAEVLEGKDPINAVTGTLSSDPDVISDPQGLGLLEAALARGPSNTITLPGAAVLQRIALVGLILPDPDGDGQGNWPRTESERLEVAKALAVNLGGWLTELGLAKNEQLDRILGEALTLTNTIRQTQDRINTLREKLKTIPEGGDALLAEYAGVVDGGLELAEQWARIADQHRPSDLRLGELVGDLRRATGSLAARDYAGAAVALYVVADSLTGRRFILPKGVKEVLSLATALAQAKDGDEVAAVLEAYAEPVQGYRGKREKNKGYFVINAYLGASGGKEWSNDEGAGFLGVSAPIGMELGLAAGNGWSLGVFGQVLDLGALASFRMSASDDELDSEPEVGFAQVFSPGGYLVLGLPKVPVALGAGVNLAPSLRKISANPNETRNATRLAFFASIDLTLFRFR